MLFQRCSRKKGQDRAPLTQKILIKKECKQIKKIKIDIVASSIQIIKGIIQKITIIAKDINYKDLLFDKIKLESNNIKIIFKIKNKEITFKNNFKIKFQISLSENSLKAVLMSPDWEWIGNMISRDILNEDRLEDIKIKNDQILVKAIKGKETINHQEMLDLKVEKGKLYLENKKCDKSIKIPMEDKIHINNAIIKNNLIVIVANSSLSF